jgi:RNA 3'-terminal phosphate cyclase (ATP)
MIEIDGSYGEGGGQILRMSVALSAVTGKDVKISNIRAGRKKPGLAAQHLTGIRSVGEMCGAKVDGLEIGSQLVEFHPGALTGGKYRFDIGTAGSIALVFQACFIPALHAPTKSVLTVTGGTDVRWSPPIDYFQNVFLPLVEKMGVFAKVEKVKRGYYPKGGGKVVLHIEPRDKLVPLNLDKANGDLRIGGISHVSNLPSHIPERMAESAKKELVRLGRLDIELRTYGVEDSFGQGGAIVVWAKNGDAFLGGDSTAERGVRAEKVGETAGKQLSKEIRSGATLDVHLSDQILPYMAMADGESSFLVRKVTNHTETNMWLIEQFFDVEFMKTEVDELHKIVVRPK